MARGTSKSWTDDHLPKGDAEYTDIMNLYPVSDLYLFSEINQRTLAELPVQPDGWLISVAILEKLKNFFTLRCPSSRNVSSGWCGY